MQKKLKEIAQIVKGQVRGDPDTLISGFSGIKEARPGDLTFIANPKYFPLVEGTKASAVVAPFDFAAPGKNLIGVENPSLAFAQILTALIDGIVPAFRGIHPAAMIDGAAQIGKDVSVGPYTIIERGAKVGERTVIFGGCYVGQNTVIGRDCLIYPQVMVRERVLVGDRVIIHSGTVIGSDGFGFVDVKGSHVKIPQIGTVEIQDDVEIGANVTIDRARFEKTVIGAGTKIDNLVQIAHNVKVGKNCIIVSQVGISGSSTLEDNVTLAGQVGVAGHLTIGENTVVASKSGVPSSIPPNSFVWGIPARPHMHAKRINACLQNFPDYVKTIQELKRRVEELEARIKALDSKKQ
jgi:UDP-3-O-[3-hydroxymyristoyl] glucosamine N-acyltransferase